MDTIRSIEYDFFKGSNMQLGEKIMFMSAEWNTVVEKPYKKEKSSNLEWITLANIGRGGGKSAYDAYILR